MTFYKDLHRQNKSLNFDSPNAEMNFYKSVTCKLSKDISQKTLQFPL